MIEILSSLFIAALTVMCLIKLSDIMFFNEKLFKSPVNFIDIDVQKQKEINESMLKLFIEINNALAISNTRISSLEKRLNKLEGWEEIKEP